MAVSVSLALNCFLMFILWVSLSIVFGTNSWISKENEFYRMHAGFAKVRLLPPSSDVVPTGNDRWGGEPIPPEVMEEFRPFLMVRTLTEFTFQDWAHRICSMPRADFVGLKNPCPIAWNFVYGSAIFLTLASFGILSVIIGVVTEFFYGRTSKTETRRAARTAYLLSPIFFVAAFVIYYMAAQGLKDLAPMDSEKTQILGPCYWAGLGIISLSFIPTGIFFLMGVTPAEFERTKAEHLALQERFAAVLTVNEHTKIDGSSSGNYGAAPQAQQV